MQPPYRKKLEFATATSNKQNLKVVSKTEKNFSKTIVLTLTRMKRNRLPPYEPIIHR